MQIGNYIKMTKGHLKREFYLFDDDTAKEITKEGLREVTCAFSTLYALLKINGWKEVETCEA